MESGDCYEVPIATSSLEEADIVLLGDRRQIHLMRKIILRLLFLPHSKMRKEFPFYTPMGKPIVGTWTIPVISQNKERIPFPKMYKLFHSLHGTVR